MMERAGVLRIFAVRKRSIAIVLVWAIVISLIMIKTHWVFYVENVQFSVYRLPWRADEGPKFTGMDWVLLILVSFLVGVVLTDAKKLAYGYFATMLLSIGVGIVYVFLYNWLVLRLGAILSEVPFGWEWALWTAILNVVRFMLPVGMFCCLIGVLTGSFIRIWLSL